MYLRDTSQPPAGYRTGWNTRYTTSLTNPVQFYLRGEEYSAQLEHFALAVGEGLEACEYFVKYGVVQVMTQRQQALAQGVAATVLAEHEFGFGDADILGAHDFVGAAMLEHAVLMDA